MATPLFLLAEVLAQYKHDRLINELDTIFAKLVLKNVTSSVIICPFPNWGALPLIMAELDICVWHLSGACRRDLQ